MSKYLLSSPLLIVLFLSASADQIASVATSTKGTLFDQAGTAIAKAATNYGGLPSTLRNYASASVFIPAIARGQVDFGVANQFEITLAVTGQDYFEGRQHENLRAVAVLFPLQVAIFVAADSPVERIAGLRGRRLPDGYVANKIALPLLDALLAADGITRNDIDSLNVSGLAAGVDAFTSGRAEGFLMALGAPKTREANSRHSIRALPINNTKEALAAMREHMPVAYLSLKVPGPASPGIREPTWVMSYDTVLFASTETGDETVFQMTRALYENQQALINASPAFRAFTHEAMAKDLGLLEYHPGAIRFYKERELWPTSRP